MKTYRKILAVIMCVVITLSAAPLGGFVGLDLPSLFGFDSKAMEIEDIPASKSGTCGSDLTWSIDTDTGVLEISGTGNMSWFSSPSSVPWYSYRSYIKTVTISNAATNISHYAFYECSNLVSINIPDSVTSIAGYVFYKCTNLTTLILPESITAINEHAFDGCTNLFEINIPDSTTIIGEWAFFGCSDLTEVTLVS